MRCELPAVLGVAADRTSFVSGRRCPHHLSFFFHYVAPLARAHNAQFQSWHYITTSAILIHFQLEGALITMAKGEWTTNAARKLAEELRSRGLDVLYSHGQKGIDPEEQLGNIVCWFGSIFEKRAMLAYLDIAIVSQETNRVFALIEIEEGSATPKKLMADAFTTLIGDHIMFQGKRELNVGRWTRLIVLARADKMARGSLRPELLQGRLNEIKGQLRTGNASLQQVVIGTFQDESDLEGKLNREIEKALVSNL